MRIIDWNKVKGQGNGLLTVVVQDAKTHEVLMVVYMNEAAYHASVETDWLTVFSRKTQGLRIQGASRGCRLAIQKLWVSCGENALLALVEAEGKATDICHHGWVSCFQEQPAS